MLASLVGLIHQPSIAIRLPSDDITFNPKEYPNLVFVAQGKVQGKIRLIHSAADDGLGILSSRIWVTKESDKDEVFIRIGFENKTLTFTLEVRGCLMYNPTELASAWTASSLCCACLTIGTHEIRQLQLLP